MKTIIKIFAIETVESLINMSNWQTYYYQLHHYYNTRMVISTGWDAVRRVVKAKNS